MAFSFVIKDSNKDQIGVCKDKNLNRSQCEAFAGKFDIVTNGDFALESTEKPNGCYVVLAESEHTYANCTESNPCAVNYNSTTGDGAADSSTTSILVCQRNF